MKTLRYIVAFVLCMGSLCTWSQDLSRIAERSILGTARYMGMCGAMTAIGGDPSAAHDNPAGLGLYQRMEVTFTAGGTVNSSFLIPQASVVVSTGQNNFMFSYRRLHSFDRTLYAQGTNGPSLGALLSYVNPPLSVPYCSDLLNTKENLWLRERGAVNEFAFDWAMNISHQWYVGLGFQVQSFTLSANAEYNETFARDSIDYFNRNTTSLIHSGAGCSFSAGVIYRPTVWLRLGLAIQTNGMGAWRTSTAGSFTAQTDSLCQRAEIVDGWRERELRLQPLRTSASVAFQFGAYGLLAFQYDFYHQNKECQLHSLRAGLEVIPVMGMYINAGYACESPFRRTYNTVPMDPEFIRQDTYYQYPRIAHYASCAIGYRGTNMLVQAAYQYRWQQLYLYPHEASDPYDFQYATHRIVVTIGWHQ